jgi:hypothetical protein
MVGAFAAVAALCGAMAPWAVLPLVTAVCWACYDGLVLHPDGVPGWQAGPDLRALALLSVAVLLGRLASGPLLRAASPASLRGEAARLAAEANPLFRPDDRRRARLRHHRSRLLATAVALGLGVGLAVHANSAAAAEATRRLTHPVTATTLADAASSPTGRATARGPAAPVVNVAAAWEYPAGLPHLGRVEVFRHQQAGARVTVWVDDAGRLAAQPDSASDQILLALLAGLTATAGAATLGLGGCWALRRRLDRRAARAWARDWARVEPHWSGRHRNEDVGGGR